MNFLIFGAGAIGSVFGGFLEKSGHEVTLVGRDAHMKAVRNKGLHITGIWGEHHVKIPRAFTSPGEVTFDKAPDVIFISVKSYDTAQSAKAVSHLAAPGTLIISLQNGIGNVEAIAEVAGRERTAGGRVIFGVEFDRPGHVEVTVYAEEVMLGFPWQSGHKEKLKAVAGAVNNAGIPTLYTEEIRKYLWAKLLYNAALNPLSTLLGSTYGYLSEHEETRGLMREIVEECFAVAMAEKTPLFWERPEQYYKVLLERLIAATAAHHPSMLQDIRKGKRTEIDAINGAVKEIGKRLKVPTPVNETITTLIHALEKRGK